MNEKVECTCDICKQACKHKPGWFLPKEAEKAAEYLKMTLPKFFNTYLGVDWWEGDDEMETTFILAPALVGKKAGSEYPGNPKGRCVFFNDGLCDIHQVKPFECAQMSCTESDSGRHQKVAKAWAGNQTQITKLLGREPEAGAWEGSLFDMF